MRTTLIPIGHAQGLRIPKPLLTLCGLTGAVEVEVQAQTILIHAPRQPRAGWRKAFARMAQQGDDQLLDAPGAPTRWDEAEWEWK